MADQERQSEFVVTIPNILGNKFNSKFGSRTTLGALVEIISDARSRVIIAAPYIQNTKMLSSGPLGIALVAALKRGARVDFISTGQSLTGLEFSHLKVGNLFHTYQPAKNIQDPRLLGSHAKFCLSDEKRAYIGSANLTDKGIAENLEMGVLLHDKLAKQVWKFVQGLFDSKYLIEVPV